MNRKMIYAKALVNLIVYAVVIAIVIYVLPKALLYFLPFVVGWIVSLIANPVVRFFEKKLKFKRKAASAIMIIFIIALIVLALYGIITLLVVQGLGLARTVGENWEVWSATVYRWISMLNNALPANLRSYASNVGNFIDKFFNTIVNVESASRQASLSDIISGVSTGIGSIGAIIIAIIMAALSAYVFTAEHNTYVNKAETIFPKALYSKVLTAYRGLSKAVSGYFKAQFKIEVWVYIITLIGLLIVRTGYAVVIAFLIAFLDLLPFFGAGLIMIPWAAYMLFSENYFVGIGLVITWGIGQLVRQIIQPKIVGDSVGLPPMQTLLALFIGFKVAGVLGMVIGVPIAMIIIALYEEGVFGTLIDSIKILISGINNFRTLPERPWKDVPEDDKKKE